MITDVVSHLLLIPEEGYLLLIHCSLFNVHCLTKANSLKLKANRKAVLTKSTMNFQYSRRIYLGDTDAAGVVYFARGMEICHEAYEECLATQGISLQQMLQERTIALPIVHAEIDFYRPLFCGDRIQVNLTPELISNHEFITNYQIFLADDLEKAVIKAQTTHVCINPKLRIRTDLPEVIMEWLTTCAR